MKKRETYGTIMVDINTHRVIDMLNSRELADVTNDKPTSGGADEDSHAQVDNKGTLIFDATYAP